MWLRVADLTVDQSYQADISRSQLAKMVPWNPDLAGAIEVSHRTDGRYLVLDGQHRLLSARAQHIEFIRAIVHQGLAVEDEALRFVLLNTQRRQPKALDLFHGRLRAGDEEAAAVVAIVTEFGLTIPRHHGGNIADNAIGCADALTRIYATGGDFLLRETLRVVEHAWLGNTRGHSGPVVSGVAGVIWVYRQHPYFSISRLAERVSIVSPIHLAQRAGVIAEGRQGAHGGGTASGSRNLGYGLYREAVREVYNRRARNQLPAATTSDLRRIALGQNPWVAS